MLHQQIASTVKEKPTTGMRESSLCGAALSGTLETLNGASVFPGTKVKARDFVAWMENGGVLSGFLEAHPQVTRQQIRDYLLCSLPDNVLPYGEEREWCPR